MSLATQEKQVMRLCLERDYLFLFEELKYFRDWLGKYYEEPIIAKFDIRGIRYQANAIDVLLLNDYKANLEKVCQSCKNIELYYEEYRLCHPYRLENKFDEYLRFLGYLLYRLPLNDLELRTLIQREYSIFLSTKKRERLLEVIEFISSDKNPKFTTVEKFIINPTMVTLASLDSSGQKYLCFFFSDKNADISIADMTSKMYEFLSHNQGKILTSEDLKELEKTTGNQVSISELLDANLILRV